MPWFRPEAASTATKRLDRSARDWLAQQFTAKEAKAANAKVADASNQHAGAAKSTLFW